jgi:CspA family cold shock protein
LSGVIGVSISTLTHSKSERELGQLAQYRGTVKWFNNAKGYGFLGRDGGADVFVHYSSIQREGYKSLKEGDEVEFDIIQGSKGPQADQVARLKEVSDQ